MNQLESKTHAPPEVQQDVVQPTTPPSQSDLLLMAKLFYLGDMGTWVRAADVPTSEPAKRVISNWVRKGYAYYTQRPDTEGRLLVLEDDCARMCGEAIAAAFEVRAERSMLDQKPKPRKMPPLTWAAAAVLTAVIVGLLVAMVTALW